MFVTPSATRGPPDAELLTVMPLVEATGLVLLAWTGAKPMLLPVATLEAWS
jgi:hypothetical protein